MGKLYKRGKTWYMHDVVDGIEIRESLKTTDWQEARRLRNDRVNEVKEGRAGRHEKTARQSFRAAAYAYVADRQLRKAEKTWSTDKQRKTALDAFFGDTPLIRITPEQIAAFQKKRTEAGMGGRTVNLEVGLLRRIMKKYRLWARLADHVELLPERSDVGRALEEKDRKRLLELAATKPRWMTVYCAAVLALNTTMRSVELRGLRWQDVDLFRKTLTIRRDTTKTDAGARVIPLNRDAIWAFGQLWARSQKLARLQGSNAKEVKPEHYVFPACESWRTDFSRPMKGWRSAWRSLTRAARLEGLRFHDLRHSSITVLAESGLSDQTIMSIAGHVSRQMLDHYSHIRMEAKREAVGALERMTVPEANSEAGHEDQTLAS